MDEAVKNVKSKLESSGDTETSHVEGFRAAKVPIFNSTLQVKAYQILSFDLRAFAPLNPTKKAYLSRGDNRVLAC